MTKGFCSNVEMHSQVHPSETHIHVPDISHIGETYTLQPFCLDHSTVIDNLPDASQSTYRERNEQLTAYEDIYSPILRALRLFGLYFGEISLTRLPSTLSFQKRRASIWLLFCCAVLGTVWLTVGLLLISLGLEGFTDITIFFRLLGSLVGYLLAALNGTICLFVLPISQIRQSRFETFIRKLIECNAELKTLRSTSRKTVAAAGFIWITATILVITSTHFLPQLYLGSNKPWNDWNGYSITILYSFTLVLVYAVLLFPIPLYCMTCLILERLFDDFYQRTTRKIGALDIWALKEELHRLCDVVEHASKVFSPLLFVTLSLQIPFICFTFFVAVQLNPSQESSGSEYLTLGCVILIMQSAGNIAIFLFFGARVNGKVCKVIGYVLLPVIFLC